MDFDIIIDSQTHSGPSTSIGMTVTSEELRRQQQEPGITHVIVLPVYLHTAIEDNAISVRLLERTGTGQKLYPALLHS